MRLFMELGPGDIVADQNKNAPGKSNRGETSITFSKQAFRLLRARGHTALLVSHNPRRDSFREGEIEFRNVPKAFAGKSGALFHLSQVLYALKLAWMARRFGAELALLDYSNKHYFMLFAFRLLGIPVAVNCHNVRWPHGFEPQGALGRTIRKLDSWFLRTQASAAMGCSPECKVQIQTDGAERLPYFPWVAQFDSAGFAPTEAPPQDGLFRVLFVGRVEEEKGVLDLVEMARLIRERGRARVIFEVCGDGGALEPLRRAIADAGLAGDIIAHGRLERAELLHAYACASAVIVPTRLFCEGMPLVCAEAILSGKPVVTSVLSNALPVIGPAIAQAEPLDVVSYVDAIERLACDPDAWRALQAATVPCRAQFLDRNLGYAACIDRLLTATMGLDVAAMDYAALYDS